MVFLALNTLLGIVTVFGLPDMPGISRLAAVGIVSLLFIPMLLIYWLAGAIVDWMTPRSDEVVPETAIGLGDLQSIAFSAMGGLILYFAANEALEFLVLLPRMSPTDHGYMLSKLLRSLCGFGFGIYFLLGAPAIRRLIVRLRRAERGA